MPGAAGRVNHLDFAVITVVNGENAYSLVGAAPLVHTHLRADITDFDHTHTTGDITDFSTHTHAQSEVTDLVGDLANKQPLGEYHIPMYGGGRNNLLEINEHGG